MLEAIKETVLHYAQQAERDGLCRHRAGNFSIRDIESGWRTFSAAARVPGRP